MDCQAFSIVFFRIPYKKRAAAQFPCAAVFIPQIRPAADMALAMNQVRSLGGGMAVVEDGRVTAQLPLPVAGLMSEAPLPQVNAALNAARAQAQRQGVNPGIDPFMTLSFMSLPVIPTLRLLTRGAFHVEKWQYVE